MGRQGRHHRPHPAAGGRAAAEQVAPGLLGPLHGLRRVDEADERVDEALRRFAMREVSGVFEDLEPAAGDGRMGGDTVSVRNLLVAGVDAEASELYVKGAVPGRHGTLVLIRG